MNKHIVKNKDNVLFNFKTNQKWLLKVKSKNFSTKENRLS